MRSIVVAGSVLVALVGAAVTVPAGASPLPVPGTGLVVKDAQPDFAWDPSCATPAAAGTPCYVAQPVSFPSRRSGAQLVGTLYGPQGFGPHGSATAGLKPAVVVIPPSGGAATQGSVSYLAKYIAVTDGFIALTVDPQGVGNSDTFGDLGPSGTPCAVGTTGQANPDPCPNLPFQQMDNFFDAGQSALNFLADANADPWFANVDPSHIGATGHSEGARAATYLQDPAFDGRVKAVVALDNLTTNWCGDAGTPSNEGPGGQSGVQNATINGEPYCLVDPATPVPPDSPSTDPNFEVTPAAPALGLASDGPGGLGQNYPAADPVPDQTEGPPTEKETAALAWKAKGIATGEFVLAGVSHGQFSQSSTSSEPLLHQVAIYTAAWFDAWLGGDATALGIITSCPTADGPPSSLLSSSYTSSVWVPGGASIDDLRADLSQTCPSTP